MIRLFNLTAQFVKVRFPTIQTKKEEEEKKHRNAQINFSETC